MIMVFGRIFVCILPKRKAIVFYFANTTRTEVTKTYEIDFEDDLLFACELDLPDAIVASGYLKQGIFIITRSYEWNLLVLKDQDYSKSFQPILSSLFFGQLKDDYPLNKINSIQSATFCAGDFSFLALTLYEDVLTFFVLKKKDYCDTNSFKVKIKSLSLKSFSFLIPDKAEPCDMAITSLDKKTMKIAILLQRKQTMLDPQAPKICLSLISFFQYNIKQNELLPERYSIENLPHFVSRIIYLQNSLVIIMGNQILCYDTVNNKITDKIETDEPNAELILGKGTVEPNTAFIASPSRLMIIKDKGNNLGNQTIVKTEEEPAFGKHLFFVGATKGNRNSLNFLSLLNKEEVRVLGIDYSTRKFTKSVLFSLPQEKKWKSVKVYGKNRASLACLKSSKYFSKLLSISYTNHHRTLTQSSFPNHNFLMTVLKDKRIFPLPEECWLLSSPTLCASFILKLEPSNQGVKAVLKDQYTRPVILDDYTLAVRDFREEAIWVQVTQSYVLWVFKSKDPKKEAYSQLKLTIAELIGTDDCFISDAYIQKDAIVLAIHNQVHILAYNRLSLANNMNRAPSDLFKYKILKLNNQINKIWCLNDFNIFMVQFYSTKGLYIYKMADQFKELKNIVNIDLTEIEEIISLNKFLTSYNGSSYNLFLLSSSLGYLQQILVSDDIMQNRSDAEFRILVSPKIKVSINPLTLFNLNDNQIFDAIVAQKQNEEYLVMGCNSGESYLFSFPKTYIENNNQTYFPFRVQDLKTNTDSDFVFPYQQTPGKISYFAISKNSKDLSLCEIELRPQLFKDFFSTDRRAILIEEVLNHFFLVCQDPSTKRYILEVLNSRLQRIDSMELPFTNQPEAICHLEELNLIIILCTRTDVIDEAPLELYGEKVMVEDITLCYFINTEGLNLYKSLTYSVVNKDKERVVFPELASNTLNSKYLSLSQMIKLKGKLEGIYRITDNFYLIKKYNRLELVRIYNKPLCIEYLNEFKVYNKSIEEVRAELSVTDLEYLDSQGIIENYHKLHSFLVSQIKVVDETFKLYKFRLFVLTSHGEMDLVEFSTEKNEFRTLAIIVSCKKGLSNCEKILCKMGNRVFLRKSGTDLFEIRVTESPSDPINNLGDAIFNFEKELVYSGEEKVLGLSTRVLTGYADIPFQWKTKESGFGDICIVTEEGNYIQTRNDKFNEFTNMIIF